MSTNPEETQPGSPDPEEQPLCLQCLTPNDPQTHFCAKCGAPLTSYASTGPFEQLFAEGHVYRQAAERPHNLIVVVGIWLIFGFAALTGTLMLLMGRGEPVSLIAGSAMLAFGMAIIWKTTRNYRQRRVPKPAPPGETP